MNTDSAHFRERATGFIKSEKGRRVILALGVIGIALIFLSGYLPQKPRAESTPVSSAPLLTAEQYAAQLEKKLEAILVRVNGAGNCSVMVTLENGVQYLYAQEEKTDQNRTTDGASGRTEEENNSEKSYVILDSGSDGKRALVITEIQPEVKGVVVVCAGAASAEVQQQVINVVTTALGISSAKVCVAPMS